MPIKETSITLVSPTALTMNILYIPAIIFLNKNAEQLMILMLFMMIDFVSGLMKSHRLCKKFAKYKFIMGVYMKFITLLIPFLFTFTAIGIGYDLATFIPFCLSSLILIEFYSILGNFYTIRTGKELEDKDILSFILLKTRKQIDNEIKKITEEK